MPRSSLHLLVTASVAAAFALTVTACSSPPRGCPTGPVASGLAIAVGDRANSSAPSWPAQFNRQLVRVIGVAERQAAAKQPRTAGATFVRADGDPSIGCVMTPDTSAGNGTARAAAEQAFEAAVQQEVTKLPAQHAQANPLAALSQASAAAGPGGTVVLMDSGLQTVAPLDFARANLLGASGPAIVSQLSAAGELPHLNGRTVILDGIGYTAPPQAPLDEDQRDHLIELWQQIARAAGAKTVLTLTVPDTDPAGRNLPRVSPVPVPPPSNVTLGCGQQSVLPDDGPVGFVAGQTTLRDQSAARPVLARIAGWLRRNPTAHATVRGSIAHYGADTAGGLPLARAGRIRKLLLGMGISRARLRATGTGWGPYPTKNARPDPVSDQLNRRVTVRFSCL